MKKIIITIITSLLVETASFAQSHSNRIDFGIGALYERGLDATLAWEHETKYHNAWEYFLNGYIKWDECKSCGHVCPESFWNNYRTWGVGIAYKPSIEVTTTMATCVSEPVPVVIQTNSSEAYMLAMNTTIHFVMDGLCIGKRNVI